MGKFKIKTDVNISHLGKKIRFKYGEIIDDNNEYFNHLKKCDLLTKVRKKSHKNLIETKEVK